MEDISNSNAQSIYIHIPFCVKKCNYCAFVSYTNILEYEKLYVNALINEIKNTNSNSIIKTIYLGGGTPNLLSLKSLEKIITTIKNNFKLSDNIEFSMEFNPKISDLNYIQAVKELGINRISLGAQSFNNETLKILGRIHNVKDTLQTIDYINKAEISNYSIDLMYGIFSQTLVDITNDLNFIKHIHPQHVSTYGLKIEEGTPFYSYSTKNLPNEDINADMYLLICENLKGFGYEHYEISNFSLPNYSANHNLTYWKNQEYFGFGVSAHGYLNKIRYKNNNNLQKYIKNPFKKDILNKNTQNDIFEEYIFLGLRLKEGINLEKIKEEFSIDLKAKKLKIIEKFIKTGHIELNNEYLSLTETGFLLSNYIIGELLS